MFKKYLFGFLLTISLGFVAHSQDTAYVRKQITELSAKKYLGRGYVGKGVNKAANYLAGEMKSIGLSHFGDTYFQQLSYPVNTFQGKVDVRVDGVELKNGVDYFIGPATPATNREYEVVCFDSVVLSDTLRFLTKASVMNLQDKLVVIDFSYLGSSEVRWFYLYLMKFNYIKAAGFVELNDGDLAWAVRTFQQDYPSLKAKKSSWPVDAKKVSIKVKPKYIEEYKTENVIGYVPGTGDEYVVICAHYDHLGAMGRGVFVPGANDNASGTAAVLDMARYYKNNPCKYTMVFMCFTGEEAGLFGSTWFTDHPLFPLEKIKFVINLDMVGTGEKGAAIVNGDIPEYQKIKETFQAINLQKEYFSDLKIRGESKNSDHYPFHAKGVKAVFFYTMGANTYYHSPSDVVGNLSLAGYIPLFGLITDFIATYE